jgi:hypothetical protein
MLEKFVPPLCQELSLPPPPAEARRRFALTLAGDVEVELRDLEPGVGLGAKIARCPARRREELFTWLMRANYLGQGTGGGRIGLDVEEKFLTLSFSIPYELSYLAFKENVESFVNYVLYWRSEIERFEAADPQ